MLIAPRLKPTRRRIATTYDDDVNCRRVCSRCMRLHTSFLNKYLELKEKTKAKKTIIPKNDYETQKKLKSLQNKQSKVEREIADLERAVKIMDSELEINYEQTILKPNFFENYNGKKDQLAVLLKKWEVVAEELMIIEG